jgi:hypothetical protein
VVATSETDIGAFAWSRSSVGLTAYSGKKPLSIVGVPFPPKPPKETAVYGLNYLEQAIFVFDNGMSVTLNLEAMRQEHLDFVTRLSAATLRELIAQLPHHTQSQLWDRTQLIIAYWLLRSALRSPPIPLKTPLFDFFACCRLILKTNDYGDRICFSPAPSSDRGKS